MPEHEFITVEELAEMARTSPSTVRYWRTNGFGPVGTKAGKRVLYPLAEVRAFLCGKEPAAAVLKAG